MEAACNDQDRDSERTPSDGADITPYKGHDMPAPSVLY